LEKYKKITEQEIKDLAVSKKWLLHVSAIVESEVMELISIMNSRLALLALRYEFKLSDLEARVLNLRQEVFSSLRKMGHLR
jgi:type I restriction enzyme M protein